MTAQQLADELEVSVRTVYRDVEALHAAGVPLYGDAGHDGGYRLLDGYRTRLTGLTGDEADSLFLAGLPGPAADLGLGAVLTAAQLKLSAALPEGLRERADRVRHAFHLDPTGWYRDADETPYLTAVAGAVWDSRRVQVRYRRWAAPKEVTRTLDPYGVVLKAGLWYMVAAADGDPARLRTYRVAQILDLAVLDEVFERPQDFDLAAHWEAYLSSYDERRIRLSAEVRFSPRAVERLPDLLGAAFARSVADAVPGPDGWVSADLPVESTRQAAALLLPLGADAEVVGPPELRAELAATAAAMAALYQGESAGPAAGLT